MLKNDQHLRLLGSCHSAKMIDCKVYQTLFMLHLAPLNIVVISTCIIPWVAHNDEPLGVQFRIK